MEKKLTEGQLKITDGPSKFDLMISLFDGKVVKITCDLSNKENLNQKIHQKIDVIFTSIGIEDGSHDSWIGEVYLYDKNFSRETRKFYYSSRNRSGVIMER